MNCRDLEELLSAYADGELSRTQREFIEEHLSSCADCRETLAQFEAAGRQLSSLRETQIASDIRTTTLSKIKATKALPDKPYRRWLRPVTAAAAIVAVIAVLLVAQPWGMESPEAMAASIVRNSPEVQAALNGEEIEEVEVTTTIVDEEGKVLAVIVRTERGNAATVEVNLETKKVGKIIRVDVPDFQPGDEQKAIDIAKTDPGVQELLAQGGVIGEVHLGHSLHTGEYISSDGQVRQEAFAIKTAFVDIELEGRQWSATVNLDEGRVMGLGRSSGFPPVLAVIIIASALAFLSGILIIVGLASGSRLASKVASPAAAVIGVIGLACVLFCSLLYLSTSMIWFLLLSTGTAIVGLVLGTIGIKRQLARRKAAITGTVLCSLALVLVLAVVVYPALWNVITITVAIIIILVLASLIVYTSYSQLRKIPRKLLRPAVVALAAVVVLIVALVQPWSVNPEGVIAKAYSATESLLSYRATISGTASEGDGLDSVIEFVFPDRFHAIITSGGETDEFIVVGDKQFVKSGDMSRNMIIAFSNSATSMLSKEATLRLLDSLTDLQRLPDENIEGVSSFHYKGRFDTEKMIEKEKARLAGMQSRMDPDDYQEMMKGLENSLNVKTEVELWIGKDDSLIRQVIQVTQAPDSEGQLHTSSTTLKYYDFNQPILIEPPLDAGGNLLPGWHLNPTLSKEIFFDCRTHFETTGEDPAHQQINAIVTVTNVAMEATAHNVRVELRNSEVIKDGDESPWIKAAPSNSEPVVLKRGEGETFNASWECDTSHIAGDELNELLERTVIKITYLTPEDDEAERMYTAGGAVYPSARPPANPPGK